MKAIILAAGFGSRLRPLTDSLPKCLVRVQGKSIIDHQLDALESAGISEVIVVVGHEAPRLLAHLARRAENTMKITIVKNDNYSSTNNMYSLNLCRSHVEHENFFWCNADVVYSPDILRDIINFPYSCIGVDVGSYDDESMKVTLKDDLIGSIAKTIGKDEAHGRSIDAYKMLAADSTRFFALIENEYIAKGQLTAWSEVALDKAFKDSLIKMKPLPIHTTSRWTEIDNHEDLMRAELTFSNLDLQSPKVWAFDLDGTLYVDNQPIEGALELIRQLKAAGRKVFFITNNSSKALEDYRDKLSLLGYSVDLSEIVLSTHSLISELRPLEISKAYILGTSSFERELRRAGIAQEYDSPEAVLIGYDTQLTYEKLVIACKFINNGIPYFVSHPDLFCPSVQGPIPDAGAITRMIEATTGIAPQAITGKPNSSILTPVLERTGVSPADVIVVGDRIATDGKLGREVAGGHICVMTGDTTPVRLQQISADEWPNLVIPSARELLDAFISQRIEGDDDRTPQGG